MGQDTRTSKKESANSNSFQKIVVPLQSQRFETLKIIIHMTCNRLIISKVRMGGVETNSVFFVRFAS